MKNLGNLDTTIKNTILTDILSSLSIIKNASLHIQANEALTIEGFAKINTVIASVSGALRSMIILGDLIKDNKLPTAMGYCNIENFFTSITGELNSYFAAGTDVNFKYSSKFEKHRSFYINTVQIEKILYALIYCLVNNLSETDNKEIKITIDEKSGKDSCYIITVSSKGKQLNKNLAGIFSNNLDSFLDFLNIDTINLVNVKRNVEALKGSIIYKNTKTLNKFILTLPHITEFNHSEYSEPTFFVPDRDLINAYLGDLTVSLEAL